MGTWLGFVAASASPKSGSAMSRMRSMGTWSGGEVGVRARVKVEARVGVRARVGIRVRARGLGVGLGLGLGLG